MRRSHSAVLLLCLCALVLNAVPARGQQAGITDTGAIAAMSTHALPHNLSVWNMFLSADVVVKAVMLSLAFASVVTWTILLAKSIEIATAWRQMHTGHALLGAT